MVIPEKKWLVQQGGHAVYLFLRSGRFNVGRSISVGG